MNPKTESELLFESYCNALNIKCDPIPCEAGQTPDYDLCLNTHQVIAEVKQLDLNDDDKRNWNDAVTRRIGSAWGDTEDRIRRKIKKANRQLKARCKGSIPGIAVIFDTGTFCGTDSTDIKQAMFGREIVTISESGGGVDISAIHADRSGKLSPNSHTTISALAYLYGVGESANLSLFHNHFAANPISPDWFRHNRFVHYRLSDDRFEWVAI